MNVFMLCCIIFLILLGFLLERDKIYSYFIMSILFIFICFSYDLFDYNVYTAMYEEVGMGGDSPYEVLFVALMRMGYKIGLSYDQFRMVLTTVSLLLINSTIQRYSCKPALSWALFIFYPGWVITTLFRHMIALSITIFALRYLVEDKKNNSIKYVACVSIAALIHSSFWFFLLLLTIKCFKAKTILNLVICLVVATYFLGSSNFLFKVFSLLPINDFAVNKYMTNSYSNINGIIYNIFRQCMIMSPGYFASYLYRKKKDGNIYLNDVQKSFVESVPALNNVFIFVLAMLYYSPNTNRMYHCLATINIISCTVVLGSYKNNTVGHFLCKYGTFLMLFILTVLTCTFESPVVFENVLKMHFDTNELINLFGKGF